MENSEKTFIHCPKCGAEVRYIGLGGIYYEECPNCGGIFLDFHETNNEYVADLLSISNKIRQDQKALDEMTIHCPKCKVQMEKKPIGKRKDMRMDSCPQCKGIWFDQNEFHAYLNPILGLVMKPSPFKMWFECESCKVFKNHKEVIERENENPLCPRCQKPLKYKCIRLDDGTEFRRDMTAIIVWGSSILLSFALAFLFSKSAYIASLVTLFGVFMVWALLSIVDFDKKKPGESITEILKENDD